MAMKQTKATSLVVLSAALLFVTACSDKKETAQPSASPAATATAQAAVNPLGKYDPPIEVTAVRSLSVSTKFRDGESIENNVWSRAYEQRLGIKVKYLWTANAGDYAQKLNVSIASGELADIMQVDATQLKQLVDSGQAEDLTALFEKYASPLAKKIVTEDGRQMKAATYGGKLMAIPRTGSPSDSSQVLWVRADWLKKLNLPEPKTMQDVFQISEAFTKQDPDGNKVDDTFGLALTNALQASGIASLKPFFNGFHAYVDHWIQDSSGRLVSGSIQPEVKTALAKLQEMYRAGQIDREFAVKDVAKVNEQIIAGKIGMQFGAWYTANTPLQGSKNQDPTADWRAYGLPSIDSTPASLQIDMPVTQYFVVKKGAKNPEAAIKMLNLMVELGFSENANIEQYFIGKDGFLYNTYPLLFVSPVNGNLNIHLHLTQALAAKDPSKLNLEEKGYYDKIIDYRNGNTKNFYEEGMYGNVSAWPYVKDKLDNKLVKEQQFFGAPTKTMSQKGAILSKMMLETFTKIIMGESPVDDFDKFVADWHKLGGDDITKEVNEWAAQQK
ncbi:MAG: extracellular solute-binding protein [Paenibacillaceae bacterium]|nr:extracellular solute-binding protein [Paenibacillaceae bacterium]